MKLRAVTWGGLLLLSHAALFFAARPGASSRAGGAAAAPSPAAVPAKASERERPQGKPSSVHAGLLAELLASDLQGEAYEKALAAIFREWIKRDLRGALVAIYGPESGSRYSGAVRDLDAELQREIAAQGVQVGEWICGGYFGSRHAEVAGLWVKALIGEQRREIALAALPELPRKSRAAVIEEFCETAKTAELPLLRKWMDPDSGEGLEDYAKRLVRFAGGDLEKIFSGEENGEVTKALYAAYKERYLDILPGPQALAASRKLPEGQHRQEALVDIASHPGAAGLAGFIAVLAEMDRLALWEFLSDQAEKDMVDSAIRSACNTYSLPGEVFEQLSGISRESTRLAALRAAGNRINNGNGEALVETLRALPRGKELDAFIESVWWGGMTFSDESGARVLEYVSEPGLRDSLEKEAAGLLPAAE